MLKQNTIQMYDPKREYNSNKVQIDLAINTVLKHGLFINGPEVKELEKSLANYVDIKHCISVSNGTDAIKIALLALDIKPGDEVITVAHTWISTAEVISIINAIPVFIDIESETYNMDLTKVEEAITEKTKAIIVVSLYGQMCDMDQLLRISNTHNIPIIEDGAQSFGATYKGKKSCSMASVSTTSFFPSKPLGCYGDGGACFTNDDDLAIKIRAIKNHGGIKRFQHHYIGLNARLDTIQAAVLNVKFSYFEETIINRNACAQYYTQNLSGLKEIILPEICSDRTHVWAQYSILAKDKKMRDSIVTHLKENNINAAIFYPIPLHYQKCFQEKKCYDLSNTENICDRIFNLPCYAEFTRKEQDIIIDLLNNFLD